MDCRRRMEHCGGASVDYYCHPIVIKPSSFYEHYRRPFTHGQLISRESYHGQVPVPAVAHQRRDTSPYHHSYHHQHHARTARADVNAFDDVTESRCVTSFTELQPASRAPARSVVVQSLDGGTGWTSTPPPFHSQHCECFMPSFISKLEATWLCPMSPKPIP